MGDLGYNKKMINFNDINWLTPGIKLDRVEKGLEGRSVCILIDNITVHIIHVDLHFKEMLYSATEFLDGGIINEENDEFLIKITKQDNSTEDLVCNEMLYSLLLSEPKFAIIEEHHKYKEFVSPGWHYINGEFVIPGEME